MSDASVIYRPQAVTFANIVERIEDAESNIVGGTSLCIDLEALQECDSAGVCLLIELLRVAQKKKCEITVANVGGRLDKLLKLYQLSAALPPSAAVVASA